MTKHKLELVDDSVYYWYMDKESRAVVQNNILLLTKMIYDPDSTNRSVHIVPIEQVVSFMQVDEENKPLVAEMFP